jgi:hypothetical protein
MFETLNRIDWELLHQQKRVLITCVHEKRITSFQAESLWGVVHLLDALQDDAAAAGRWTFPGERVGKEVRDGRST